MAHNDKLIQAKLNCQKAIANITMQMVATMDGLALKGTFAKCPFHSEKTASLKVYPGDRGFHCFGCGKSGSVVNYWAYRTGAENGDAAKDLLAQFGMLEYNEGDPPLELKPTRNMLDIVERNQMLIYNALIEIRDVLEEWLFIYEHSAHCVARVLTRWQTIEYALDCLTPPVNDTTEDDWRYAAEKVGFKEAYWIE